MPNIIRTLLSQAPLALATVALLSLTSCIDPVVMDPHGPRRAAYRPAPAYDYADSHDYNRGGYYRGNRVPMRESYSHQYEREDQNTLAQRYYHERGDHRDDRNDDRGSNWGGPDAWYKSGKSIGQRDRREGKPNNWQRHRNHYDGKTAGSFARGYRDGYFAR